MNVRKTTPRDTQGTIFAPMPAPSRADWEIRWITVDGHTGTTTVRNATREAAQTVWDVQFAPCGQYVLRSITRI